MPILALIIIVAAIVWGAVFVRRYDLVGLCLLVLLAGCLFGHAFYHYPLGPVPLTVDRVLFGVLAAVYAGYRYLNRTASRTWTAADAALLVGLAVLGTSAVSHDWRAGGAQPLATLLFFFVMPAGMYWIMRHASLRPEQANWILVVLAAFTAYLALTAVAEHRQWWFLVVPRYIASPDVAEFLGRARGPFLNPVACGIYLAAGWFAGLMFWPRCSMPGKLGLVAFSGLAALGLLCTLTRSVWLAAVVGLFLIVGLSLPRRARVVLVASTALAAAVAIPIGWEGLSAFKRDRDVSVHDMSRSAQLRPILARVAWNMFRDRPVFGCGFGQYGRQCVYYLGDRTTELPLENARPYVQHNVFLAVLTETGLAGLVVLVALGGLWWAAAWRLWSDATRPREYRQLGLVTLAALVAYVVNGLFHDVSIMPMTNTLVCLLAGAVVNVRVAGRRPAGRATATSRSPSPAWRPAAAKPASKGGSP